MHMKIWVRDAVAFYRAYKYLVVDLGIRQIIMDSLDIDQGIMLDIDQGKLGIRVKMVTIMDILMAMAITMEIMTALAITEAMTIMVTVIMAIMVIIEPITAPVKIENKSI